MMLLGLSHLHGDARGTGGGYRVWRARLSPQYYNIYIYILSTSHKQMLLSVDRWLYRYTYMPSAGGMCQRGMVLSVEDLPVFCVERQSKQ